MSTRVGVDVGGTFTDLILYDDDSRSVLVEKVPSVPTAPDACVLALIRSALPSTTIRAAELFLHGTTVGINALLERTGARVGLLTSRGFRDILEMRRGERDALYDVSWKPPPPLVPRRFRLPVTERISAGGVIEQPLERADVERGFQVFQQAEIDAIAVVFLNSYANPAHELEAEQILRDLGFDGEVSVSSATSGEYREYERTSTTVVDAYVRPKVSGYLRRLEQKMQAEGFTGTSLVTRSGGGAIPFSEASKRPVETIMSGPVAGAVGGGGLCRKLHVPQAITADVGGTSFDTCLIIDGHPQLKFQGVVGGMPLQLPWVDVRSIGAGGGSLAYVDEGGLLRVGPKSAGSTPGPACYGRGGTRPTVTDAAAVLGMLAHGDLAGNVRLAFRDAERVVSDVGTRLGLSLDEAASGIITIANAAMADAVRSVTVEQGYDPRSGALIAFGGAGPLFAGLLAHELEIPRILIPNHAGNFSAWGLLAEDIVTSAARTMLASLDGAGLVKAEGVVGNLAARLRSDAGGALVGASRLEVSIEMRYAGQEYTLTIPAPTVGDRLLPGANELGQVFETAYERVFGYRLGEPIELVAVRAALRTPLPHHLLGAAAARRDWTCKTVPVQAYSFVRRGRLSFEVIDRTALEHGDSIPGPCLLLEPTATTYVDSGFEGRVLETGVLELLRAEAS